MKAAPRTILATGMLCAAALAWANPHRLDDSLSHTVPPQVQMQWRDLQAAQGDTAAMEAWLRVNVRIDTRDWVGRSGRVYMVLARDQASHIEAVWTSGGRLLPGRLLSGERSLVYAGTLAAATLEDQLLVRLRSGTDWHGERRQLQFHFEFEVD